MSTANKNKNKRGSPPPEPSTPPKRPRTTATSPTIEKPGGSSHAFVPSTLASSSSSSLPTCLPTPPASPVKVNPRSAGIVHSDKFGYSKDLIHIRVEGDATVYHLNRDHMVDLCGVFSRVPESESRGWLSVFRSAQTTVYEVTGLTKADFELFLEGIYKGKHYGQRLSEQDAVAIYRATRALRCETICDVAARRLHEIWNPAHPPHTDAPRRDVDSAINIVLLARKYGLRDLLKCPLYELATAQEFWDRVDARPESIPLSLADMRRLERIRRMLDDKYSGFLHTPPGKVDEHANDSVCVDTEKDCPLPAAVAPGSNNQCGFVRSREATWLLELCVRGKPLPIPRDPLRVNWVKQHANQLSMYWCVPCLEERNEAWEAMRESAWAELDDLFR